MLNQNFEYLRKEFKQQVIGVYYPSRLPYRLRQRCFELLKALIAYKRLLS